MPHLITRISKRGPRYLGRGLLVPLVLAILVFLVAGAGPWASSDGAGWPDPVSLSELGGIGGATHVAMTPDDVARRSTFAVDALVVDVQRSRLNTTDGLFPGSDQLEKRGTDGLTVLTDVTLEVKNVYGDVAETSRGAVFTVTVGGGLIVTDLDLKQANAIGVLEVVEEFAVHDHDDGTPPDHETEVPVTRPVRNFVFGSAPSVDMAEGDVILVFLENLTVEGYDGAPQIEIHAVVHPSGVLHQVGEREWNVPEFGVVDAEVMISLLGECAVLANC